MAWAISEFEACLDSLVGSVLSFLKAGLPPRAGALLEDAFKPAMSATLAAELA